MSVATVPAAPAVDVVPRAARPPRRLAVALAVLALLFAGRVAGQALVAARGGVAWLPPMDAWTSGLVPYPLLLGAQLVILAWQARVVHAYWVGGVRRSRRRGDVYRVLGLAYAGVMAVRALALWSPDLRWLADPIPVTFHLVLATMVLLAAAWHRGRIG